MYYEIEHWLMIIGIFGAGMLSMLGLLIWADIRQKAKRPRMPIKGGYDPRNPINKYSVLNEQYAAQPQEDGWYEVRSNWY